LRENRIAHAPAFAQTPGVLACVSSDAFSATAQQSASADVNGIELVPFEVQVDFGWAFTLVVKHVRRWFMA
jgi:hypothetical protein